MTPPASAVATLRRWWEQAGRAAYPDADRLLVTADAGGHQRLPALGLEDRAGEIHG
jgi:Rhodopirellula transposase DDE domain